MKHQIDTMSSIRDLVVNYSKVIDALRIENEQLRLDLEDAQKEIVILKAKNKSKKRYGNNLANRATKIRKDNISSTR
jgi:hypothetical protein